MVQWRVGDVWRWLRYSAPIELLGLPVFDLQPVVSPFFSLRSLADSEATGSQEQDCAQNSGEISDYLGAMVIFMYHVFSHFSDYALWITIVSQG